MNQNKALIHEYLQAISGKPKPTEIVARFVADPALAKHIADVEAAFPRYELIAEDTISEGDLVVVRGLFNGVHRGPFAGIEPTGRQVSAGLIIIYRLADAKIVDHWMELDRLGLLQQLQASPAVATN